MKIKAYKGTFAKKDGSIRKMLFSRLEDLPQTFLDEVVQGTGSERIYPEGMELVFDLEEDNFRIFNHSTAIGDLEQIQADF